MMIRDYTRHAVTRRRASSTRSLLSSTVLARAGALGLALSGALLATPAWADCTPTAADGVTATCIGTTSAGTTAGYGTGVETGVTVNVAAGATVTGTSFGIGLGDATVTNGVGATITGANSGIYTTAGSADVINSGTITGNSFGIFAATDATVTNNAGGSINGGTIGIAASNGSADVTNYGSITGTVGIAASTRATVTNYAGGTITGIGAGGRVEVTNFGNITGTISGGDATVTNNVGASILGGVGATTGSANVINSGSISGSSAAISGQTNATVVNTANAIIAGDTYGIATITGTANVTNSGSVTGNNIAIVASKAMVTNNANGSITGGQYGIAALGGGSSVFNAGTISGGLAAIAFSGAGNTLTLAQGSVINGGVVGGGSDTFQLGGTGAATFDISALGNTAQYQGFTTFNKVDSSVWTLTGTGTFAGPMNVNGGTLDVEGSIVAASMVTVNSGATLMGAGTARNVTVADGGRFAPGDGTPNSSMTVSSLTLATGAQYVVSLDPSTSSRANVTGNASLGGATVNALFASSTGYIEKQYTILNAGSITGTFNSTVVNTNLPSGFKTSLSYDTAKTKAYLNLALDFTSPPGDGTNPDSGSGTTPPAPAAGLNGNQSSAGNAIINYFNTKGSIPVAFGALTPQGLTQVSGEVGASGQSTSFQASSQFMNIMGDVTAAGRGFAGSAGGAMGYSDNGNSAVMAYAGKSKPNNPLDAFASFAKAPPVFVPRWSTWMMGFGGSQTTDGNATAGTNTASSSVYGVAVGADYRFSPDTIAGFALAGGGTNFSVTNGGSGRSDLFQAGAFVRHNIDATYIMASAAYSWQDVTTDRYLTVAGVDHLRAEFNANSYSGRLELGHRFLAPWFGGLGVSPYAAVQATVFDLPSYAERAISGASTFALNYSAKTSTATRSELGVRTDKAYALDGAVLTLRGRAAWAHDFNPDSAVMATFQSLPGASFVVNGAQLAPNAALTTASAEVSWTNGWSVAATFEGEFSNVTRSYAGKGVLRYDW